MQETRGTGRHVGELVTVVSYVLTASTLFYALRTRSTAYQEWVDVSEIMFWGEFVLAHSGSALAGGRLRAKPPTASDFLVLGAIFLGLVLFVGNLFLQAPIQSLTYGGLLAGRVWTAMKAARNEIVFFQIRSGVALVSIIAVLAISWQQSGAGMEPPFRVAALAWYFVILAVAEFALLLARAMRHRSIA